MAGDQAVKVQRGWRGGWARWRRLWRHHGLGTLRVRQAFSLDALRTIEQAIADSEREHRAELRFVLEAALSARAVCQGQDARTRALEVFAQTRLWDTEDNTGVLIYVLWADRAVEIVADRGAARAVDPRVWQGACAQLTAACRQGQPVAGVLQAIASLTAPLAQALPVAAGRSNPNELPDAPLELGPS